MKRIVVLFVLWAMSLSGIIGCSQENRDEAVNRLAKAGKALNGEVRPDDVEHAVPNIVAEQQRKERIKQNTQWTPENQALHPIEYCQAKLEETKKMGERLDVQQHTLMVTQNGLKRKLKDLDASERQLTSFLDVAKKAYRDAEGKNSFPMQLNGYSVTKEKAQMSIVEAHKKLQTVKSQIAPTKNSIAKIEQRLTQISKEQRNVVLLRDKLEMTLGDLKTKQVIDGERGIGDALKVLEDSMAALQQSVNEPTSLDIMVPDTASQEKNEFDAIMAQ